MPQRCDRLPYLDHVVRRGLDLFRAVCETDPEGVVAKQKDGVYPDATAWLKHEEPACGNTFGTMRDHWLFVLTLAFALTVSAAGCGPSEQPGQPQAGQPPAAPAPSPGATSSGAAGDLRVTKIVTGRSVNPDNTERDATVLFLASNDVWATVVVEGNAPHATLHARWLTDSGKVLEESSQEITPTGHTVAAFHITAPSGGWPLGHYKLELLLDGVVAGTQDFEIQKPPL